MPIGPYLDAHRLDPEAVRVMGIAFEMAREALRLADRDDVTDEVIATRIIDCAKGGELDPHVLCEHALKGA
jgi:hypothetical protein